MGRSVSYPSAAQVITFKSFNFEDGKCGQCEGTGSTDAMGEEEECPVCDGTGHNDSDDFDMLIDDFRDQLRDMFPSVVSADDWIGQEDHVLAENGLARFGMSEYCGLVSYWIVPKEYSGPKGELYYSSDHFIECLSKAWVDKIADRFVAAFGELSKVGSMSNGEGVYRRIDK